MISPPALIVGKNGKNFNEANRLVNFYKRRVISPILINTLLDFYPTLCYTIIVGKGSTQKEIEYWEKG